MERRGLRGRGNRFDSVAGANMLVRYATAASTYAHSIDHLFLLIAALVGFWLIVAEVVMFVFVFKYREKEGHRTRHITGEEKELHRWVTIPHMLVILCDIAIIIPAIIVWYNIKQALPPADQTVRVYAQQWAWSFQEPGPDGVLDTADDVRTVGELHVTVNKTYHFELLSRDVVHSFAIPAFRLKQDALPGRTITGWFRPDRLGTYDIQCTQICGLGHALMAGRVIVETQQEHAAWLMRNSNPPVASLTAAPVSGVERPTMAEVRR
jgi:cytochrome c oxidase subunit 2